MNYLKMGLILSAYDSIYRYFRHLYYRTRAMYRRWLYGPKQYKIEEALNPCFGPPGAIKLPYGEWGYETDRRESETPSENSSSSTFDLGDSSSESDNRKGMFPDEDNSSDNLRPQFEHSSSEDRVTPPLSARKYRRRRF